MENDQLIKDLASQLSKEVAAHNDAWNKRLFENFIWKGVLLVMTFISAIIVNFNDMFGVSALGLVTKIISNVIPCIMGFYTLRAPEFYADLNRRLRDEKSNIINIINAELIKSAELRSHPDDFYANISNMLSILHRTLA